MYQILHQPVTDSNWQKPNHTTIPCHTRYQPTIPVVLHHTIHKSVGGSQPVKTTPYHNFASPHDYTIGSQSHTDHRSETPDLQKASSVHVLSSSLFRSTNHVVLVGSYLGRDDLEGHRRQALWRGDATGVLFLTPDSDDKDDVCGPIWAAGGSRCHLQVDNWTWQHDSLAACPQLVTDVGETRRAESLTNSNPTRWTLIKYGDERWSQYIFVFSNYNFTRWIEHWSNTGEIIKTNSLPWRQIWEKRDEYWSNDRAAF